MLLSCLKSFYVSPVAPRNIQAPYPYSANPVTCLLTPRYFPIKTSSFISFNTPCSLMPPFVCNTVSSAWNVLPFEPLVIQLAKDYVVWHPPFPHFTHSI